MAQSRYKNLIVWQKAMCLAEEIYGLTRKFPASEINNLSLQMRRAAVSVPSNIAEGQYRFSATQNRQFLKIAYGSCAELETQLELAVTIGCLVSVDADKARGLAEEVMMILNVLIKRRPETTNL